MHVISKTAIVAACRNYPKAEAALKRWLKVVQNAKWQSIADVRLAYPDADPVVVKSGRTVTVFNVCRNEYRLVVALHYNRAKTYVLRFMTHADYSKNAWKDNL
ncbi:MAG TPA: type II toxin-antitoxin system HigB family toxin [Tepidisphaeraceae bacterium]|jgi:mRNA interferase HigB|nr:type II toxin-antitoxin system HigB family toxin [Tepidisphaeraceae bacterium]